MNRGLTLLAGAAIGAVAAVALRRRRGGDTPPAAVDPRAQDLRRKLAEARETAGDEEEFEAAGMAAETIVEEDRPIRPAAAMSGGDVEEARRRIHEEARRAADEMRRSSDPDEK
jgi:hypothetical protein